MTSLSVTVALMIGTIELLQVVATKFDLDNGFWSFFNNLDFGKIGYGMVGLFALTWAGSITLWRTRRIEERWSARIAESPQQ